MGRFYDQVGRYLEAFPAEHVRVYWFRDWVVDPRATYLDILDFLGLEDDGRSDFPRINQGVRFRSRQLVRFLQFPPAGARRIVRWMARATGLQRRTQQGLVDKAVRLLSAPGYRTEISPKLRDEIRFYYAEDNRRLNELLASTAPKTARRKSVHAS